MKKFSAIVTFFLICTFAVSIHAGETLDAVKNRGYLVAGVNTGAAGFSMPDNRENGPAWMWISPVQSPPQLSGIPRRSSLSR